VTQANPGVETAGAKLTELDVMEKYKYEISTYI
jgi:hypothetical protein